MWTTISVLIYQVSKKSGSHALTAFCTNLYGTFVVCTEIFTYPYRARFGIESHIFLTRSKMKGEDRIYKHYHLVITTTSNINLDLILDTFGSD